MWSLRWSEKPKNLDRNQTTSQIDLFLILNIKYGTGRKYGVSDNAIRKWIK